LRYVIVFFNSGSIEDSTFSSPENLEFAILRSIIVFFFET
jgi:hypothetical protein